MARMTRSLRIAIALAAIVAPALHLLSDVMEWQSGFSPTQLWTNYVAFVIMLFMIIGLYAVQRPRINIMGLVGAVLYGISFIYFASTTMYALQESIADYETLWARLGTIYTVHGGLMVAGGLLFGVASLRARVLNKTALALFIAGIIMNFLLSLLPVPEIFQTVGSTLRNIGLITMGIGLFINYRDE